MDNPFFFHAIKIDQEKCIGCAHCMKACPTEAIRIVNGKATLHSDHCVDCGECFRVCPVRAYSVTDDDIALVEKFEYRVAILPSVFFGQFPDHVSLYEIHHAMQALGFTHVYEIEGGVDILFDAINDIVADIDSEKPVISSFCPAIVRLIQVKFPSLVDNISKIIAPLDLAANYYRKKLSDEGVQPEKIGVFYITPCAAKIAAVNSPVGDFESPINGVINLDFLFNKVFRIIKQGKPNKKVVLEPELLESKALRYCLTNGEAKHVKGRSLCIDGIHNVIEFLELVETEQVKNIDFLELRACDESCAGGILIPENRFLTVERLNKWARYNKKQLIINQSVVRKSFNDQSVYLKQNLALKQKIEPRMIVLDNDRYVAMKKMEKTRDLMCFLPGIDCGACGAPTCMALATDIVNRKANLSHCIFMQRQMEKHNKLSHNHAFKIIEKVWGTDRLNKDCSKKGAKNENF